MADLIYNSFKGKLTKIDWELDLIKVILLTSAYSVDQDAHLNKSDIDTLGFELPTANGYTFGGTTLLNRVIEVDNTSNLGKYKADKPIWPLATLIAHHAIIYYDSGDPATSTLIGYINFLEDKYSNDSDFSILWHLDGIFTIG